jgi:hypothetical protein
LVGKPKGVLHSTAGYMLYVATTFKYTFDHQAGGGDSSNAHHSFYSLNKQFCVKMVTFVSAFLGTFYKSCIAFLPVPYSGPNP